MTFDYTKSVKINTAKRTKSEDALRYMFQLFEREEQEEKQRSSELNRIRCRINSQFEEYEVMR